MQRKFDKVFRLKDQWLRTAVGSYQVSIVNATRSVAGAIEAHGLQSGDDKRELAACSTVSLLLSSMLKGEERVVVRMLGDGRDVLAESVHAGELRGYVQHNVPERPPVLNVSKVLYGASKPFNSTVPLSSRRDTADFQAFFDRSESAPSRLHLWVDEPEEFCGGMLVQTLPPVTTPYKGDVPRADRLFVDDELSLRQVLLEHVAPRLADSGATGEVSYCPVHFFCRCSQKQVEGALSPETLQQIRDSGEKAVCHYCNKEYAF